MLGARVPVGPENWPVEQALCKFAEKLLRHAAHGAGRGGLAVGGKVLDNHRQNSGERHLNDLGRDAGFLRGFFDEASAAEALLHLLRGCGGGLTGAP